MMDLNLLLRLAKDKQIIWNEWEAHPDGYHREGWKSVYRAKESV